MKRRDGRALDHKTLEEIRVRAVDAGNDPDSVAGTVPVGMECDQRGAAVAATGADRPAAVVPCDGARPATSAAMAGTAIPGHSRTGPAGRGGDLLWRRSGRAIGLPCRDDVGREGKDARGAEHGTAPCGEPAFGSQRPGTLALHGGQRQGEWSGLCRVPETVAA